MVGEAHLYYRDRCAGLFLGVSVSETADATGLEQAYGEFQREAYQLNPRYLPQSVNADGWEATQQAWKALFPHISVVLCFLHTIMGIQRLCRRSSSLFQVVSDKLWHWYDSLTPRQFGQRLRRLLEWAKGADNPLADNVRQKLLALRQKVNRLKIAFELPGIYRTSNQVDRLMNYQERLLYAMQYFHGTLDSAKQTLRAMALLWNFHPYCCKVQAMEPHSMSPFEDLNGFRYHDNWLRNFLIASSLNGRGTGKPIKHKLN